MSPEAGRWLRVPGAIVSMDVSRSSAAATIARDAGIGGSVAAIGTGAGRSLRAQGATLSIIAGQRSATAGVGTSVPLASRGIVLDLAGGWMAPADGTRATLRS